MSKRLFMIAVDGSDHSGKAVDVASNHAKACGAELLILHVAPEVPLPEGLERLALEGVPLEEEAAHCQFRSALGEQITKEAKERALKNGVDRVASRVVDGHPAHEIVKIATSENVEMIFLGSRGLSDMMGLVMGSVSHKVLHQAPCPCVAVK